MKNLPGLLVSLLLVHTVYAERIPDRTLDGVIRQFGRSLQHQTSTGDWSELWNSPEEGFAASTLGARGQILSVVCSPGEFYGAFLIWPGSDSLGTDYNDGEDQPVILNWLGPLQTQRMQWTHFSLDQSDADSVGLVDQLRPAETDDFLNRLTRHDELYAVVTVSESGETKQTTFSLDGAPSAETVKACGQEQTSASSTLYFPDFVDGGGWSVQLVLSNLEAAVGDATVGVSVYDSEGRPVRGFFDRGSSFEIPALGSRVLRSAGSGAIRRGWIEVEADSTSVSGLLTYRHAPSGVEVGVKPVELGNQFALFVEESRDTGTGLAVFKPESESAIELRIRDEEGKDPLDGVFIPHEDFQQRARTMPEWFGAEGVDTGFLRDFRGLLFLRSADGSPFAPLGLRFGKQTGSLSAVPAIRGGEVSGGTPPSSTGGAPPTVGLSASPTSVERGQSATLRWSSTNAASASITPGIGNVPTSGSRRVSPTRTTTYRITVRSSDGQTALDTATVTVTDPPPDDADDFKKLTGFRVRNDGGITLSVGGITLSVGKTGCIVGAGTFNGQLWDYHQTWWQRNTGSGWQEVSGTKKTGRLCGYDLGAASSGTYRAVGDMTIAGTRGKYKSENEVSN